MGTSVPGTRWGILALCCAIAGCAAGDQSGDSDATARCNGSTTTLLCCEHDCDNDVFSGPSCVNGEWVCPPDHVSSTYCPGPRFCQGPLAGPLDAGTGNPCDNNPGFACCVGECTNDVTTSPVCNASGWHCPAGTASQEDCPGQPFCLGGNHVRRPARAPMAGRGQRPN